MSESKTHKPKIALVLQGGGARAAYQVGAIKAISEILPRGSSNPFPIITGTSAGAINAATLAAFAGNFREATKRLSYVWRNFRVHHVYRSDTLGILKTGLHWLVSMLLGGIGRYNPMSLFDRSPLYRLLARYLPCENIQKAIDDGHLYALAITATGYTSGQSVSFFQGKQTLSAWNRVRRLGVSTRITLEHLMASSAIPFVFPAVKINREYFGDGSMRQLFPLSSALHLGADKVLVIGVRYAGEQSRSAKDGDEYPSLAQIAGHVMNSIFLDSLEIDLERLQRINKTISLIPDKRFEEGGVTLRPVEPMVINPTEDLQRIANKYAKHLPRAVRFLLRGIGAVNKESTSLISYILFEKPYCRELIALGYADTMQRKEEIRKFLEIEDEPSEV
ncbi:MAG TPA: patatin-like phospholipase family protein [Acidiferrobacteraceae bacterium]|nr:patatin-like phospholipase family protein [Acidiferrobacteraceae bacterium]HEX20019.1 patatin-like phospholipase family protein [Acidiferrobacteraceae bacterium]